MGVDVGCWMLSSTTAPPVGNRDDRVALCQSRRPKLAGPRAETVDQDRQGKEKEC